MSLRGKHWITPERVIDCSDSEHARYAMAYMLNLTDDEMHQHIQIQHIFNPSAMTASAFCAIGTVGEKVLEFLSAPPVDPRVYVIRHHNWIRVWKNKFYAWRWDEFAIAKLLESREYWKSQHGPFVGEFLEFFALDPDVEDGKATFGLTMTALLDRVRGIQEPVPCSKAIGG